MPKTTCRSVWMLAIGLVVSSAVSRASLAGYGEDGEKAQPAPEAKTPRVDFYGDPLPDGAVARLGARRFRHEGNLSTLKFTPDSHTLVGYTNSGIMMWDAATGKELRRLSNFTVAIDPGGCIDISPDGGTLAVGDFYPESHNASVSFWDMRSGKKHRTVEIPDTEVCRFTRLCFSLDGKNLAMTFDYKNDIYVMDVASGKSRVCVKKGELERFYDLAISPDCETTALAVGAFNPETGKHHHSLQLRDMVTGKLIRRVHEFGETEEPNKVVAVSFAPDGKMLAFASSNQAFLYNSTTGEKRRQYELSPLEIKKEDSVLGLTLTRENQLLVFKWSRGKLLMLDVDNNKIVQSFDLPGPVAPVLSPDRRSIAVYGRTMIRLFDVPSGKERFTDDQGHDSGIKKLAFTPDGKTLVSAEEFGGIFLWDTASWKRSRVLPGRAETLSFSPGGKQLAMVDPWLSESEAGQIQAGIRIWDLVHGKEELAIKSTDLRSPISAAFTPDGRKLVTLDYYWHDEKTLTHYARRWDLATGKQEHKWPVPQADFRMKLASDAGTLVAEHRDSTSKVKSGKKPPTNFSIYHFDSGRRRLVHDADTEGHYEAFDFSPDSRILVGMRWPNTIREHEDKVTASTLRFWEVATGKNILFPKGRQVKVPHAAVVAWSPVGRLLATGDYRYHPCVPIHDQGVRLWDSATGKELACYTGLKADVADLAFSPDGKFLASGLCDGTILIWDVAAIDLKLPPVPILTQEGLELRWADLAGGDASTAYQAIWTLAASPRQSVPFLKHRLKPVPVADQAKLQKLIADLNSDTFAIRQAATKELEKAGEQVQVPLRKALTGNISLETRRRLEQVLNSLLDVSGPETIRTIRAIMILERIGSREAQAVLEPLAHGAPGARETEEAKASLQRLGIRTSLGISSP